MAAVLPIAVGCSSGGGEPAAVSDQTELEKYVAENPDTGEAAPRRLSEVNCTNKTWIESNHAQAI